MKNTRFQRLRVASILGSPIPRDCVAERYLALDSVEPWTGKLTSSPWRSSTGTGKTYESDDLLFGKLRPYLAKVWVAAESGAYIGDFLHLRPHEITDSGYLSYVMRTPQFINEANANSYGSKMPRIEWEQFKNLRVPVPPLEEQRRIAEFLDHETAEIDTFIADQLRMVELTTEHFRSRVDLLIESVVASYTKIKYVADVLSGFPFKSKDFKEVTADVTRLLRGVNIEPSAIRWADSVGIESKLANEYPEYLVETGDLVLGLDRPLIRGGLRLARIGEEDANSLLVQRVARIRPKDENSVINSWVEACLLGRRFRQYLEPNFTGVSVPHMSPAQLVNFSVPLPRIDEQKSYVSRMSDWSRDHDKLVTDLSTSIELSQERRSALISAAVTGQIDVSDRYAAEKVYEEVESVQ